MISISPTSTPVVKTLTPTPVATPVPVKTATPTPIRTATPVPVKTATAAPTPISNHNPIISTKSLRTAILGSSYKTSIVGYDVDTSNELKMVITNLPLGINLGSCTTRTSRIIQRKIIECTISGTPKKEGQTRVDISLFDNSGGLVQRSVVLTVRKSLGTIWKIFGF